MQRPKTHPIQTLGDADAYPHLRDIRGHLRRRHGIDKMPLITLIRDQDHHPANESIASRCTGRPEASEGESNAS